MVAFQVFYPSPIGPLLMESDGSSLTQVVFLDDSISNVGKFLRSKSCDALQRASTQLDEYFLGTRRSFTIPILQQGTPFELLVWRALQDIPYGKTVSYADVATMIGTPQAIRAVASAIASNCVLLFIPCHRIIRKNNMIGGYSGGLWRKLWLIAHEYSLCPHFM